jgi:hypothetical protein
MKRVHNKKLLTIIQHKTRKNTNEIKEEVPKKFTVLEHYFGNHKPLSLKGLTPPKEPYTDTKLVETITASPSYPEKGFGDTVAHNIMNVLKKFVHLVFNDRYTHHAVVLETGIFQKINKKLLQFHPLSEHFIDI